MDDRIHDACAEGQLTVVIEIIEKDPTMVSRGYNGLSHLPHECAAEEGHLEIVKYLVSKGCDIFSDNFYALQSAAYEGHLDVVKYLVSIGGDVTVANSYPIRWASGNGHLEVVKYLLSVGADLTDADNYAFEAAQTCGCFSVCGYITRVIFDEMKKYTLLLLLNNSRVIHKDLSALVINYLAKYLKHYHYYQRKMK